MYNSQHHEKRPRYSAGLAYLYFGLSSSILRVLPVQIFFLCCHAAADVTLRLVYIQNLAGLLRQSRVNLH